MDDLLDGSGLTCSDQQGVIISASSIASSSASPSICAPGDSYKHFTYSYAHANHRTFQSAPVSVVTSSDSSDAESDHIELKREPQAPRQQQQQVPANPASASNPCIQSVSNLSLSIPSVERRSNLFIWDWDDTIFPTWAFRSHHDRDDVAFPAKLQLLASYIELIFRKLIATYGARSVVIVTNASDTWIHKCLNVDVVQATFRSFQSLLKQHDIVCLSASTSEIRAQHPSNHFKWKEIVFKRVLNHHFCGGKALDVGVQSVTSIGDSQCEYRASASAVKHVLKRTCYGKYEGKKVVLNRVLLQSNPSIDEMIAQLAHVASMTDYLGRNQQSFDVDLASLGKLRQGDGKQVNALAQASCVANEPCSVSPTDTP